MASRLQLQSKLVELLGSDNVYYQPPETVNMKYPAIVYSKNNIDSTYANDQKYSKMTRYSVIVVSKKPDSEIIDKILDLPYCSYDRHYITNNLNHDSFTLYY